MKATKNISKSARNYLVQQLGSLPEGIIRSSRYYPPEESWTKRPSWWHEFPLTKLRDPNSTHVHIICEKDTVGFFYLKVPKSFFLENITSLCIRDDKNVSLFLSADPSDMFIDYGGKGQIEFSEWLTALEND
jgi:hypothetical protein